MLTDNPIPFISFKLRQTESSKTTLQLVPAGPGEAIRHQLLSFYSRVGARGFFSELPDLNISTILLMSKILKQTNLGLIFFA